MRIINAIIIIIIIIIIINSLNSAYSPILSSVCLEQISGDYP